MPVVYSLTPKAGAKFIINSCDLSHRFNSLSIHALGGRWRLFVSYSKILPQREACKITEAWPGGPLSCYAYDPEDLSEAQFTISEECAMVVLRGGFMQIENEPNFISYGKPRGA